jgi:hypothetical protein
VGCFLPGRTPIFIVYSDAGWHNGPGSTTNFYAGSPGTPTYPQLTAEMTRRGARFISVDVASSSREHSSASARFAADTNNIPAGGLALRLRRRRDRDADAGHQRRGTPSPGSGPIDGVDRGDRRPDGDPAAPGAHHRRVHPHDQPAAGRPDAPTGYDRREGATFVGVANGTTLTFNAVLANDLVMPGAVDQVFGVYVNVYGNGLFLEQRAFYVLVPAQR